MRQGLNRKYTVLLFFFSFFQVLFAVYHYPLLGDDSIAFLPASINLAEGHGLINNVYGITRYLNQGQAEDAYVNYPPIFPLIHGYLLTITHNLHLSAALINILLMAAFVLLVRRVNKEYFSIGRNKLFSLIFLFLAAWSTQLSSGDGRPEALAELWMVLLAYNALFNKRRFSSLISGFLIGLAGFTHPVAGIYSLFIFILFLCWQGNLMKVAWQYTLGGIVSLLLMFLIYPFSLSRLVKGISDHGKIVASRSLHSFSSFIYYHFASPYITFYFLIFILGVAGYFFLISHNWRAIKLKAIFIATAFAFSVAILYFSFHTMEVSYNLYVLLPVYAIGIFYLGHKFKSRLVVVTCSLVLLVCSAGFARRTVLFAAHIKNGEHFSNARKEIKKWALKGKVGVTASFYTLPADILNVTDDIHDPALGYFIYQQNFTGLQSPPVLDGFTLIADKFSRENVYMAGVKISNSPPGYQYALYKRTRQSGVPLTQSKK